MANVPADGNFNCGNPGLRRRQGAVRLAGDATVRQRPVPLPGIKLRPDATAATAARQAA